MKNEKEEARLKAEREGTEEGRWKVKRARLQVRSNKCGNEESSSIYGRKRLRRSRGIIGQEAGGAWNKR
jgi:hypothetical protein